MSKTEPEDVPVILVVDDEVAVRRSLGRLLSRQGFTVIEAGSMDDALAATKEHSIHVALVDCPMAGTEGSESVQTIHKASPNTEIVALTAMGSSESAFHDARWRMRLFRKTISDWHRFFCSTKLWKSDN